MKYVKTENIEKAGEVLRRGGIVIFPTDTAFGIGCRMDDENAVKRLFEIRKRSPTQATSILIDSLDMVERYIKEIPVDVREKLIDKYWPGALTIVLPCREDKVLDLVRGGSKTLGIRSPDHEELRRIIKSVGVPILGPSANFHGEPTPYEFDNLNKELIKLVDYVVEGECRIKQASTVIDCSIEPWKILRRGALNLDTESDFARSA